MNITVTVALQGFEKLAFSLGQGIPQGIRAQLRATVDRLAAKLQRNIRAEYLSGAPPGALNVQTGDLRRSINVRKIDTATEIKSVVGTNVIYGRAWELGLVPAWAGQPGKKVRSGKQPARPFIRPAFDDMRVEISTELTKAVGFAIRRGLYGGRS